MYANYAVALFFLCTLPNHVRLRNAIQSKLDEHGKSTLEFSTSISFIFSFSNSFANAFLFLVTNVKAKKILRKTGI